MKHFIEVETRHQRQAALDQFIPSAGIAWVQNKIIETQMEPISVIMRCYFNLVDGHARILDHDGIEVLDLDQARVQALKAIEELLEEDGEMADDWRNWTLEVTNESGTILFSIPLNGILH
ncbi:DUF6894 family protein [Microvirga puerhi]|uniref:DUF6894 domain-containing protein n=1 Tax=Microvirga puerhi TaxID=2876078 RepID=A0ABS7VU31_9HYPH|nr:hypothetical protein [Microvirga puerhi]MBZ6078368.1 hypothetical protein [Microvirga puerhi]